MLCCRCDDYTSSQPQDATPAAMLALDLWLPPSYHVDTWGLLDAGQLGPALRWSIAATHSDIGWWIWAVISKFKD